MILQEKNLTKQVSESRTCSFCGSSDVSPTGIVAQLDPLVSYAKCESCFCCFADRHPTPDALSEIYDPENYSSQLTDSSVLSERLARRIVKYMMSYNRPTKKRLRILDFGGGNGKLSSRISDRLEKHGYKADIVVLDIHDSTGDKGLEFVHADRLMDKDNEILDGKFDLVLASAVLEHVLAPRRILDRLLDIVSDQGTFYARTPWEAPMRGLKSSYKLRWPRHLFDFGGQFWSVYFQSREDFRLDISHTSIIETPPNNLARYSLAWLLKLPSRLETSVRKRLGQANGRPIYQFVGGWEVFAIRDQRK